MKEKDQHQEAVDLQSRFETLEGKKQIEKVLPMLLAFQILLLHSDNRQSPFLSKADVLRQTSCSKVLAGNDFMVRLIRVWKKKL